MSVLELINNEVTKKRINLAMPSVTVTNLNEAQKETMKAINEHNLVIFHLGNLVSLTDHCDLFFVCQVDITSRLINETPSGPYQI